MKKIILILLGVLLHQVIFAQIYSNAVNYYSPAGEDLKNSTTIYCVKFSNKRMVYDQTNKSTASRKLQENNFYYRNLLDKRLENPNSGEKYEPKISTNSKEVYHETLLSPYGILQGDMFLYGGWHYYYPPIGNRYTAFTKDLKEMIIWEENNEGDITFKKYYIKIQESDLKPKAVNRDFLE